MARATAIQDPSFFINLEYSGLLKCDAALLDTFEMSQPTHKTTASLTRAESSAISLCETEISSLRAFIITVHKDWVVCSSLDKRLAIRDVTMCTKQQRRMETYIQAVRELRTPDS
jgi:hypothetical protein